MKTLLLLVLILISANVNAFQIEGDFPQIQFGYMPISALDVCVEGANFKTVHAVPICYQWAKGEDEKPVCVRKVKKHLKTSVYYSKQFPAEDDSFENKPMKIPLKYKVAFGYMTESGIMPVYFQDFSIPSCDAFKVTEK